MSEKEAEEILVELKEKAELMVDLAYSSIIYDNKDIAQEVYELEDLMDALNNRLQKLIFNDVKNDDLEVEEALVILRLGIASESISDAAQEIADVQLRDVELHPILRESLLASHEVFHKAQVDKSSVLVNKTLGKLELASKTGVWVIAIRRKKRWIYGATENTVVREGDILFVRGVREGMEHFMRLTKGEDTQL